MSSVVKKKINRPCPKCNHHLVVVPIGSIFDKDGSRFGGTVMCPDCGFHDMDTMLSPSEIEELVSDVKS